jgi:hypothetical protein
MLRAFRDEWCGCRSLRDEDVTIASLMSPVAMGTEIKIAHSTQRLRGLRATRSVNREWRVEG